jgi:lysophospholipase L1-like esterase
MRLTAFLLPVLALLAPACSSETIVTTGPGGPTPSATNGGPGGGPQTGPGNGPAQLEYKSYVILGDSVSAKGGQAPYFYDLLVKNDDAKYPDFKGKDLTTRYGADLKVVFGSRSGALSRQLPGQVTALPASLPGPVLVTVTVGGNDMRSAYLDILAGRDQPARDTFKENLERAYAELTKPDRFGPGVQVKVFEASIYDPTDGNGDFRGANCPSPLNLIDPQSTDPFFASWNGVLAGVLGSHTSSSLVVDAHARFRGHGVSRLKEGTSWFVSDCIHPSAAGHDQLRRAFWEAITSG